MPNKTPTPLQAKLSRLEARHRAIVAELAGLGLVLRGSIAARKGRCGKPSCRCARDPEALHGPYHMWTRKRAGKTVTVVLSPEQAAVCQQWTQNMRRLDRLVLALQLLGQRAAEAVRAAE